MAETLLPTQGCARRCMDCVECLSPLPPGKACNDCAHVRRCKAIFGVQGSERWCDFIPSRWRAVTASPESAPAVEGSRHG